MANNSVPLVASVLVVLVAGLAWSEPVEPRFFFGTSTVTIYVSTTTSVVTSTPTCWVTTNAPAVSCNGIRRRAIDVDDGDSGISRPGILDGEEGGGAVDAVDAEPEKMAQSETVVNFGYFYPQSAIQDGGDDALHLRRRRRDGDARFLIALATSTVAGGTVRGTSTVTTTVTCSGASKITACV